MLLCPFHQEKTPSCVISPEKNLYHCFGCGAAGSVVDWMMKTEGFSLPKALLGQVVSWYHQNLLNSPDALAWLEGQPDGGFQIAFLDPPFADGLHARVLERLPRLLAPGAPRFRSVILVRPPPLSSHE